MTDLRQRETFQYEKSRGVFLNTCQVFASGGGGISAFLIASSAALQSSGFPFSAVALMTRPSRPSKSRTVHFCPLYDSGLYIFSSIERFIFVA